MSYFECFLIMVALLGQRVLLPEGAHHHNRSTKQNKIACSFDASFDADFCYFDDTAKNGKASPFQIYYMHTQSFNVLQYVY